MMTNLQLPPKKTKIVCTIGPASESQEVLEQLISNGMMDMEKDSVRKVALTVYRCPYD